MDLKGIILILLFLLLLCLEEYLLYYYGIKPQYDRQNLYQKASCTLTNKKYITTKVDKQLFDPNYYDGKEMYGTCHECSDISLQDPTKNCDYMMKNNNETGECCIHLGWISNDCCFWSSSRNTKCDTSGNNCETDDDTYCISYASSRVAFVKDEIYTITYDININDLGTSCSKTEKCSDPITSQDCLIHKMDKDYENICYYKKQDNNICDHLSEKSHSSNKIIVTIMVMIIIISFGLYCAFVSSVCEEFGLCSVTSTGNSRRNRNRYIELV